MVSYAIASSTGTARPCIIVLVVAVVLEALLSGSSASPLSNRSWYARGMRKPPGDVGIADDCQWVGAFVLVLVLGLRRGEVLGLAWDQVDLDAVELYVGEQLQRVRHQLVRRQVKTETSEAPLPLPDLCVAALKIRRKQQGADRDRAGDGWIDTGLVFTTRHGTPIEPRNFNRSFDRCIISAKVPRIAMHGTRKTCASLLAALDVHTRVAMRILRHSKIAVTMEIYTEAPSEATRDALRKLSDWLT